MRRQALPPDEEMYTAFVDRDAGYDGIFLVAVRTTGIFCRPSCPARKAGRPNVEYVRTAQEALAHGYRPCKRCRPMEAPGRTPDFVRRLLAEVDEDPSRRIRDADLRDRGLDPATVRRWFNEHHGMTFHAYQRGRRLAGALRRLADGDGVTEAAFANGYDSVSGFQEALRKLTGTSPARSRDATVVHVTRTETPLGPMLLAATDDAVCLLEFTDRRALETQLGGLQRRLDCTFVPGRNDVAGHLEEELRDYFAGTLRDFTTALLTPGTDLQCRAWQALREIPYGETVSYGEQARRAGVPRAVRPIGRANGQNRIAIVIPCHRVVGADGSLTGYGGGLWRKRWLLHHERSVLAGE